MKILYVCHRLISFLVNDIVELKKLGHDITILSVHRDRSIYDKIVLPMLKEYRLSDNTFINFKLNNGRNKVIAQMCFVVLRDIISHPFRTIKRLYYLEMIFKNWREKVNCYIDTGPVLNIKYDIIHSPFSTPDNIRRVYYISSVLNVPYTLSFRAHDIYAGINESMKEKKIIENASNIFITSAYYKSLIAEKLAYKREIQIIHGPVDIEFFKPNGCPKRRNSIISVCRFDKVKGIIYLLKACQILEDRAVPFHLFLVGEGPEEVTYRDFIGMNSIPNISIINYLSRDGVKEELSKSEIFVLPGIILEDGTHDILPNSVKEAMAIELPVVTSDICGIRELVDDRKSGILVPPKDPQALAAAIEELLSNEELASEMGKSGRKKILSDFNVQIEGLKLAELLYRSSSCNKYKLSLCHENNASKII